MAGDNRLSIIFKECFHDPGSLNRWHFSRCVLPRGNMYQMHKIFELLEAISVLEPRMNRENFQTFDSISAVDFCEAKKSWYSKVGKERTCSSNGIYCLGGTEKGIPRLGTVDG